MVFSLLKQAKERTAEVCSWERRQCKADIKHNIRAYGFVKCPRGICLPLWHNNHIHW